MTVLDRVEAVTAGLSVFADALRDQGAPVVEVDWRPPAGGDAEVARTLTGLWGRHGAAIAEANARAVSLIEGTRAQAVTVAPAGSVIPGMEDGVLLHSGPPIEWERVCDPQRRALLAAAMFEGWASDRADAEARLARGEITLASGNEHDHVGPMTGVCSPSMPVWVVEDADAGVRAYSTLNEGPGRTLWFGVGDDEAIERLRFFRDDLGPRLARMLSRRGPDRRVRSRRAGSEHGRRAAHAQPGHGQPADPRPRAGAGGRGRRGRRALPRGQPPLLPQPHDGRRQVRVDGDGRLRRLERSSR